MKIRPALRPRCRPCWLPEPQWTTAAFTEFSNNLVYARDLVRGGRYLERLGVTAFDVGGLYRAAWVHAVSALDHWVHRELYDRALGFALNVSIPRPSKFLTIEIPMSLFEDVQRGTTTLRDAFRSTAVSRSSEWLLVADGTVVRPGIPVAPLSCDEGGLPHAEREEGPLHRTHSTMDIEVSPRSRTTGTPSALSSTS
jgi:hypothetical protein